MTDDWAAIQGAINAAPDGSAVVLPPARMFCSQTVVVEKPIALRGEGINGVVENAGSNVATELIFPPDVTGIRVRTNAATPTLKPAVFLLENLTVRSQADGLGGDGAYGVHVTDGLGRLNNVYVRGFPSHGFFLQAGSTEGGGQVNLTMLDWCRSNGNGGDGIRLQGSDCQRIMIMAPNITANHGWGINVVRASTNTIIAPHFDQTYHGSPGAIRDCANSTTYLGLVYAEQRPGTNGGVVLLDTDPDHPGAESVYCRLEFSQYAGNLQITDNTLSRSAWLEDRESAGRLRQTALATANRAHRWRWDAGVYSWDALTLTYAKGEGSSYASKQILSYSRSVDRLSFFETLTPATSGTHDLGTPERRWRQIAASDLIRLPVPSTRPTGLGAADAGAQIWDQALGKPIYWNGTGWVDSTGTGV
ncbi:hypothetical protein [Microlunatus sp. Y2014]|uniref:hypothetical protein n=1 Tax=Microlunatus sp. Y2014 TaxID=3418488 RepID=UPI003DA716F2